MKLGKVSFRYTLESKLGDEFFDIGDELAQDLKDELENQEQVKK